MGTDSTKKTVSGHVVAKLDLRSGELAALQGPGGIAIREATNIGTHFKSRQQLQRGGSELELELAKSS